MRAAAVTLALLLASFVAAAQDAGAPQAAAPAQGAAAAQGPAPPPGAAAPAKAETKVTYVTTTSVYIDAGTDDGIVVGDKVEVVRDGRVVAVLEVTATSSKKAVCGRLASDVLLQVGDAVRFTPSFAARSREALAIAALAEPAAATSTKKRDPLRAFGLRGRIGARYLYVKQTEGAFDRSYSQPALDLRLTGTNLGGSHIDLGVDVRARRTYRTLGNGESENEDLTRVYSAFGAWNPNGGPFRFALGRQFSPSLAVVSIFDGVTAEYRRQGFAAGLFTGSQPDGEDFGYSTQIREHGGYVEFGSRAGGEHRWAVTTGLVGSYDGGEVNREFAFVQGRYDDRRWNLYVVSEIDVYRDWRKEAEDSSYDVTSTFASARFRVSDALAFNAGYDNRRNVRLWRDYISPETDFDDSYRQGEWVGVDARFGRHFSGGLDARRSDGGDAGTADAYSLRLAVRDLTRMGIDVRGRATRYENPYVEGMLYSLSAGARLASWTGLLLHGGLRDESARTLTAPDGTLKWIGLDWDVNLGRRWLFMISYEHTTGQDEGTEQLYTNLSYRF